MSTETTQPSLPIKDVVKTIQSDIKKILETEQYLRKDIDANVAKTMSLLTKFETIISKKEDTDKLKANQISVAESFNTNMASIKTRLDVSDKELGIMSAKIDAFINTTRGDNDTNKIQIKNQLEQERLYNETQNKALSEKLISLVQALDDKLTAKISAVEQQTMV